MYCWVTTGDGCFHTADMTQLDFVVGKLFRLVETRRDCRQQVANSIHTADATQLNSWAASASTVCIGLKTFSLLTPLLGSKFERSNRVFLGSCKIAEDYFWDKMTQRNTECQATFYAGSGRCTEVTKQNLKYMRWQLHLYHMPHIFWMPSVLAITCGGGSLGRYYKSCQISTTGTLVRGSWSTGGQNHNSVLTGSITQV